MNSEDKFDFLEEQAMFMFDTLQERANILHEKNGGNEDRIVDSIYKISVDNIMLRKVVYSSYRKVFT